MKTYILPILAVSCASANAALISVASQTAYSDWPGGSVDVAQLTNGSGLSAPLAADADLLTSTHSNSDSAVGQWHINTGAPDVGNLDFTFASAQAVGSVWIWNANQVAPTNDLTNRGVATFELYYSTDNGGTYTQIGGTNNLTESPGAIGAPVSVSSEGFDIGQTGVTNVRVRVLSDHGGSHTGLSEVAFSSADVATVTGVPEPSSTALLGLGGLALILRRRK